MTKISVNFPFFKRKSKFLVKKERNVVCFFTLVVKICGKKIKTKKIEPIKRKAANKPKSRNATEDNGVNVRNAPTVVMLPINNGGVISFNVVFILGV